MMLQSPYASLRCTVKQVYMEVAPFEAARQGAMVCAFYTPAVMGGER